MRECLGCGKPLPRRKERGHREREYCSDLCRQQAWRARNKDKHNLDRMMRESQERFWTKVHQEIHRETWQDELEHDDKLIKGLLEDLQFLEAQNKLQQLVIESLENKITENEAEIVYLKTLLEGQSKQRRPHH
jgi:hypothetical protein